MLAKLVKRPLMWLYALSIPYLVYVGVSDRNWISLFMAGIFAYAAKTQGGAIVAGRSGQPLAQQRTWKLGTRILTSVVLVAFPAWVYLTRAGTLGSDGGVLVGRVVVFFAITVAVLWLAELVARFRTSQ